MSVVFTIHRRSPHASTYVHMFGHRMNPSLNNDQRADTECSHTKKVNASQYCKTRHASQKQESLQEKTTTVIDKRPGNSIAMQIVGPQ